MAELPPGSDFYEKLQDVVRAGERAADLTRQLLAYSGKDRHYMQKVDLSTLVRKIHNLLEAGVPKKVTLALQLAPRLPRIEADVNQIQQVVLNLVSNAAEAIGEEQGSITIRTGSDSGNVVYLEVRDTGCGMDEETRARIFDPFFTTKFTGRGLGLAAVAGILRGHKASVQVTSAPGEGSAFRITFTAAEEATPVSSDVAAASGQTVLVVDDEDMVRRIARATLETRGYSVAVAGNGLEAIQQIRQNPDIAVVLLDLTMPVMSGEEAIDQILSAHPGVQVIVSTGYDHREAVSRFGGKRVAGYLQKPYTSRQLAEKVNAAISRAAGI
jgi:CheY-like chemotaxis protein